MNLNDFDFEFPKALIGQNARPKGETDLLLCSKKNSDLEKIPARKIVDLLEAGDCLVINNTKVIPARLLGQKSSGGKFEILLVQPRPEAGPSVWEAWVRPGKQFKVGKEPIQWQGCRIQTLDVLEDGTRILDFGVSADAFHELLAEAGKIPLPPYIEREAEEKDKLDYQTVWAKKEGAVAAPTASFHFSEEMVERLKAKGVVLAEVTLHVGPGTFKPVEVEDPTQHPMHGERFFLEESQARLINECKAKGGRIISVGTTATRVLETLAEESGLLVPGEGVTHKFIYPGYQWKIVDGLLTNFHWPKSTLVMLVSSFYGSEKTRKAYQKAIESKMLLFSYGDGMLIL